MDRKTPTTVSDHSTILVVDRDDRIYKIFGDVLCEKYNLVFIPNEALARKMVDDFPFALVFVGQCPESRDGLSLIHVLKSGHPSIPVVFIARQPSADLILSAFRAGARDIVTDPVDPVDLLDTADRAVVSADASPASNPSDPPAARFNLKNLWMQLRAANQGYVKFGLPADRSTYSLLGGVADGVAINRPSDMTTEMPWPLRDQTAATRKQRDTACMRIMFLGSFQVLIRDRIVDEWPSKKGKSIFAYLSYHSDRRICRDVLMDVFWPKSMRDSARNSLNVAIHGLRKRFQQLDPGKEYIVFSNECYSINPEMEIWTDVNEFCELWMRAQNVERSQGLEAATAFYDQVASAYSGDFMSDELYEDWSTLERENLKEIFLVALEKISECRLQAGSLEETISICKAILERDGCREEIYRRLMCCYQKAGRRDRALSVYRQCVRSLKDELDVEPSSATAELYKKIKTDAAAA
ncbi:MAG TPA: BTAD domain-containing putative transcriptional regulator [Syntrophales bacterium]|nr:BTAD domain-containing putative transcriptional regulator [Syntrophales bacterium]